MKGHRLDPFSLVIRATFTLMGVTFLLTRADIEPLRWVWPLPIIVLGALIVAVSVRRTRAVAEDSRGEETSADL